MKLQQIRPFASRVMVAVVFGLAIGAFGPVEQVSARRCAYDRCEQDIIWDDCVDAPLSPTYCDFQSSGECWDRACS